MPATFHWNAPSCENLAAPRSVQSLFERARAAAPNAVEPYLKLAGIHLDSFRYDRALEMFAAAHRLAPGRSDIVIGLARLLDACGRPGEALALLDELDDPAASLQDALYLRGRALERLGQFDRAELAYRGALGASVHHRAACGRLCRLLRDAGRFSELLALCEQLSVAGASHAQLLLDWGRALAITGDDDRARSLLFDPARVTRETIAMPDGFNAALSEELLSNPYAIAEFPSEEEANRGSSRVHHLMCGTRPELPRLLLGEIQRCVERRAAAVEPPAGNAFDPWAKARPRAVHFHPWGLIQIRDQYEAWHTHRGGWLSGVYYVRVPRAVSEASDGRGALEFGPPPYLARTRPGFIETRRYSPREGVLMLAPSHYHHRTIPSFLDDYRVSFAFDVVCDDNP